MDAVFIPFPRRYYDALVRYSDGKFNPAEIAELAVERWVGFNAMDPSEWFMESLGDRARDLIEEISPGETECWDKLHFNSTDRLTQKKDLIWKELTVPHGSAVRMSYRGIDRAARVINGAIDDAGERYSPSEWASLIAEGTQRNAWRDLYFLFPNAKNWSAASALRAEQRARIKAALAALEPYGGENVSSRA